MSVSETGHLRLQFQDDDSEKEPTGNEALRGRIDTLSSSSKDILRSLGQEHRDKMKQAKIIVPSEIKVEGVFTDFNEAVTRFKRHNDAILSVYKSDEKYKPGPVEVREMKEAITDMMVGNILAKRALVEKDRKCPSRLTKIATTADILVGLAFMVVLFEDIAVTFLSHWFYTEADVTVVETTAAPVLNGSTVASVAPAKVITEADRSFILQLVMLIVNVVSSRLRDEAYKSAEEMTLEHTRLEKIVAAGRGEVRDAKIQLKYWESRRKFRIPVDRYMVKESATQARAKISRKQRVCCLPDPLADIDIRDFRAIDVAFQSAADIIGKNINDAMRFVNLIIQGGVHDIRYQIATLDGEYGKLRDSLEALDGLEIDAFDLGEDSKSAKTTRMWIQIVIELFTLGSIIYEAYDELTGDPNNWAKLAVIGVYFTLFIFSRGNDCLHIKEKERIKKAEEFVRLTGLRRYVVSLAANIEFLKEIQTLAVQNENKASDAEKAHDAQFKKVYAMVLAQNKTEGAYSIVDYRKVADTLTLTDVADKMVLECLAAQTGDESDGLRSNMLCRRASIARRSSSLTRYNTGARKFLQNHKSLIRRESEELLSKRRGSVDFTPRGRSPSSFSHLTNIPGVVRAATRFARPKKLEKKGTLTVFDRYKIKKGWKKFRMLHLHTESEVETVTVSEDERKVRESLSDVGDKVMVKEGSDDREVSQSPVVDLVEASQVAAEASSVQTIMHRVKSAVRDLFARFSATDSSGQDQDGMALHEVVTQ